MVDQIWSALGGNRAPCAPVVRLNLQGLFVQSGVVIFNPDRNRLQEGERSLPHTVLVNVQDEADQEVFPIRRGRHRSGKLAEHHHNTARDRPGWQGDGGRDAFAVVRAIDSQYLPGAGGQHHDVVSRDHFLRERCDRAGRIVRVTVVHRGDGMAARGQSRGRAAGGRPAGDGHRGAKRRAVDHESHRPGRGETARRIDGHIRGEGQDAARQHRVQGGGQDRGGTGFEDIYARDQARNSRRKRDNIAAVGCGQVLFDSLRWFDITTRKAGRPDRGRTRFVPIANRQGLSDRDCRRGQHPLDPGGDGESLPDDNRTSRRVGDIDRNACQRHGRTGRGSRSHQVVCTAQEAGGKRGAASDDRGQRTGSLAVEVDDRVAFQGTQRDGYRASCREGGGRSSTLDVGDGRERLADGQGGGRVVDGDGQQAFKNSWPDHTGLRAGIVVAGGGVPGGYGLRADVQGQDITADRPGGRSGNGRDGRRAGGFTVGDRHRLADWQGRTRRDRGHRPADGVRLADPERPGGRGQADGKVCRQDFRTADRDGIAVEVGRSGIGGRQRGGRTGGRRHQGAGRVAGDS